MENLGPNFGGNHTKIKALVQIPVYKIVDIGDFWVTDFVVFHLYLLPERSVFALITST